MLKKFKFPLLFKLIFLIGALLVVSNLTISKQNSDLFSQFSFEREEAYNLTFTKVLAQSIETATDNLVEKSKNFSLEILEAYRNKDLAKVKIIEEKLKQNPSFHKVSLVKKTDLDFEIMVSSTNKMLTEEDSKKLQEFQATDYRDLLLKSLSGEVSLESLNFQDEKYLLVVIPLIKEGVDYSHQAVVLVHPTYFYQYLNEYKKFDVILTDSKGAPLVSSQGHLINKQYAEIKDEVLLAVKKNIKIMQKRYEQSNKEEFILSHAKTKNNLVVFLNLATDVIKRPSIFISKQGQFVLGLVISVAFFFIFVFSSSITRPIERLTELMKELSTGNFNVTASDKIKSRDEVGSLAKSFDDMASGLREREKMKNLFNKMHGSAVASELLSSDSMKPGGTKRDVVVFFSDIRGFTDFSEKHTAEEVVEMLNSYFEVMVAIINASGGTVDKFIGDAIVAVWGIPEAQPNDAHKAIKACLDMRLALADFNKKREAEGKNPILMGAGLNCGYVISGTIGSSERMEYTVIGDTVNTAARIEASTKGFGTDLLISEALKKRIEPVFITELAGKVEAKGKSEPLSLFNVKGYVDEDGVEHIIETEYSSYQSEKVGEKTKQIDLKELKESA